MTTISKYSWHTLYMCITHIHAMCVCVCIKRTYIVDEYSRVLYTTSDSERNFFNHIFFPSVYYKLFRKPFEFGTVLYALFILYDESVRIRKREKNALKTWYGNVCINIKIFRLRRRRTNPAEYRKCRSNTFTTFLRCSKLWAHTMIRYRTFHGHFVGWYFCAYPFLWAILDGHESLFIARVQVYIYTYIYTHVDCAKHVYTRTCRVRYSYVVV